ncbi:protein kinase domain-containing protein [Streptomyces sp. NBC_00207]|uniref:protein kinase domain-containing protein n=2 Tax=unclassified Streptomyces TaxID=2593676 RepID=UPI0028871FCE|nr:protein kinase [Streptomyces sp. DSM 41633]
MNDRKQHVMKPLGAGDPIRLGPYRVLGVLGEGGMGKVYFGRDDSGRTAAVKVLLPELAHDPHLAQRFLREAHTARAVTSGGVARVLDAQTEDTGNRPWIATEFLSGPTLDDAVRQYGPLGSDGVRALAASLAATLRDIHAVGLVHRDLKPANIVLTSAGPRIIDFGIARPEHGLTLTTTGQVPVTPGYGAPEQVLGQRVGPAADVFSLGAVLAYAATGRRAYDGTHVAAVQYEVVHGQPELDSVPPELRVLIAPCLAKDPAHRPTPDQMAGAFAPPPGADRVWRTGPLAKDIERRGSEAVRQATVIAGDSGTGPSRRRLLRTGLVAGGVLAASGGTAGAWWLLREEPRVIPPAGQESYAEALSLLYGDHGTAPRELWGPLPVAAQAVDGVVTTPLPVLDVVVFAAKGGGLAARLTTDGKEKWRLPGVRPAAGLVALPGHLFVTAGDDGELRCFEGSTSRQVWSVQGADTGRILAADASAVYLVTRGGKLRAVDTAGRKVRWTVPLAETAVRAPGPRAATGKGMLVFFGADGDVLAFDTATGRTVWRLSGQAKSAVQPLVVDDVVFLGGRSLQALNVGTGVEVWDNKWNKNTSSEEPQQGAGGWGPAALQDRYVLAMDGTSLSQVPRDSGLAFPTRRSVPGPIPHTPPVVEGRTVWFVEADGRGVSAHSTIDRGRFWTWSPESRGPWGLSSAGYRVFLVNDGKLTAMPTIG